MVRCCMICRNKNDDYYHKEREGGGHRVMIEIIISENDDNDGWPLNVVSLNPAFAVILVTCSCQCSVVTTCMN